MFVAKHKGKGRGRFAAVRCEANLALSTLANVTVIRVGLHDITAVRGLWSISCDLNIALKGMTAGEGPLIIGVSHSDYTVGEIKECLEADTLDFGNKVEMEQAQRKVREFGVISAVGVAEALNDGKQIRVKTGFYLEEGKGLDLWVWNKSGGSLAGGAVITGIGKHYVRWQ